MSPLPQATICSSGCCRSLHGGSPLVGRCLVGNVRSSVPSPLISFSAFSLLCCATASLLVYFKETNETESDNWTDNCRNHPLSFCCFFFFLFSIISIIMEPSRYIVCRMALSIPSIQSNQNAPVVGVDGAGRRN